MADSKTTALTANTTPQPSYIFEMVSDPGGSPLSQKITFENFLKVLNSLTEDTSPALAADFLLSYDASAATVKKVKLLYVGSYGIDTDGSVYNGKISATVSSNNLTVALKTLAGTDPSATDPVTVRIGSTVRTITAALSVTKNAATNWFGSGGAAYAAKEMDYFAYLIWNTTPATDVFDIGFSRISYGNVYSDFSGTTTNEKYLAYGNASAPTATDNVINIGRFAATLSAGAGYTWTVPTFTTANLIQRPIYETRWLTFAPVWTNFTLGNGTEVAKYRIIGDIFEARVHETWGSTTSIGGAVSYAAPFTPSTDEKTYFGIGVSNFLDSGTNVFLGMTIIDTGNIIKPVTFAASGSYQVLAALSSTVPFTWTTNDTMSMLSRHRI